MHPSQIAAASPDKLACVMADGSGAIDYRTLELKANQGARVLRAMGVKRGDVIALLGDNSIDYLIVAWAAQRIGTFLTCLPNRAGVGDMAYILRDSGAKLLIADDHHADVAKEAVTLAGGGLTHMLFHTGAGSFFARSADMDGGPIEDASPGTEMLYSSGTTGRPKGVKPALPVGGLDTPPPIMGMARHLYGMDADTIYLSTSPLYHAAPLRWAMAAQRLGATVVLMERFEPEETLRLIERFRITHGTFVPTHFVRMLRLPEDLRRAYDLSSLRCAIHAAAPCPPLVKQAMIDWWGEIVQEYYSGTETCGITVVSAKEWLLRPGSVGKAVVGSLRIVGDDGRLLPAGEIGGVYFADGPGFSYHNDPAKTAAAHTPEGWATMGDVGHVDEEGYLFLADRKDFMIISGGVNVYPQEIEDRLISRAEVVDAAVFGVPDDDLGQAVMAVVQPHPDCANLEALHAQLIAFCRMEFGPVKCPKHLEFSQDLPRTPTGKLMKTQLIKDYAARRSGQTS